MEIDLFRTGIISRQDQGQLVVKQVHEIAQVAGSAVDIFSGMERVAYLKIPGGLRHQLHQPLGPFGRNSRGIKVGFHLNDGLDQFGIDPVGLGSLANVVFDERQFDLAGFNQRRK